LLRRAPRPDIDVELRGGGDVDEGGELEFRELGARNIIYT
jgi:hypothetical protein